MSKKRRTYPREFKLEAIELAQAVGPTEASKSLGVHANTITKWKRDLEGQGDQAFPGNGRSSSPESELTRLRAENRQLRLEREILKKATAFFAREGD